MCRNSDSFKDTGQDDRLAMLVAVGPHLDGRGYRAGPATRDRVEMTVKGRPLRLTTVASAGRFRTLLADPTDPWQEESSGVTTIRIPRLWLGFAFFEAAHNGDRVLES